MISRVRTARSTASRFLTVVTAFLLAGLAALPSTSLAQVTTIPWYLAVPDGLSPAPQDSLALGNRTPLILIHGWQVTNHTGQTVMDGNSGTWNTFLQRFKPGSAVYDPSLAAGVKPYLFTYYTSAFSDAGDSYLFALGGKLKTEIELYDAGTLLHPEPWSKRPIVIVAHSMGGLVARSFMQRHWWDDGSGQCGERVLKLITLATPHHGTPLANNATIATDNVNGLNWDAFDGNLASGSSLSSVRCMNAYEEKGAASWCSDPAERSRHGFFDRIIAYGGGADPAQLPTGQGGLWSLLNADLYTENDFFVPAASSLFCNDAGQETSNADFCDHQLVAALSWQPAARRRTADNCSHIDIHEDTPCTVAGVPVLQQVTTDICAALPAGHCTALGASLTASPSSGPAPLRSTLRAALTGTAQGKVNFTFWRDCSDPGVSVAQVMQNPACGFIPAPAAGTCIESSRGKKCNAVDSGQGSATFTYSLPAVYTPKVIIERGDAAPAEARATVTASSCPGPSSPSLLSPGPGAQSVPSTPLLAWALVAGASPYDVRVCSDAACAMPIRVFQVVDAQWGVTPSLAPSTTYSWQVRANNACGSGPWSTTSSFTVAAPGGGGGDFSLACSPAALSAPPGGGDGMSCTATSIGGFSGSVALTAQGLPAGTSASSTNWTLKVPSGGSVSSAVGINVFPSAVPGSYSFQIVGTAGGTMHSASVNLLVGGGPDFSFSCSPAQVTGLLGSSASSSCAATSLNGFAGTVSLSQDGGPAGIGVSFSPASLQLPSNGAIATTTVTFAIDPSAQTGTWNTGLVATSGGLRHEVLVTLGINAGPDFSLSCNPATFSTVAGAAASTACVVTPAGGFNGQVGLDCQTASPNVSCSMNPGTINLSGSAQGVLLSAVASPLAEPIGYNLSLSATSGNLQRSGSAYLVVQAAPDFSLSCDPVSMAATPGNSTKATCTIQSLNGFTAPVTLACMGLPGGVTCSSIPGAVAPPSNGSVTATMTLAVAGGIAAGNYAWTVHATAGALGHDLALNLNVLGSGSLWERTYANGLNDSVNALVATSGGGMVLAGNEASGSSFNTEWGYLLKLDGQGNVVWKRTYNAPRGLLEIWSIAQSGDGFIVAGRTLNEDTSCGDSDLWLARLDAGGSILWQENIAACGRSSIAWSVIATADGGYLAVGDSPLTGAGSIDAWVVKVDALGAIQWQRAYGTPTFDRALSVRQTADGGYVVVGETATNGEPPVWVMKLDGAGNLQWQHGYGGAGLGSVAVAYGIEQMSDGGYVFSAWSSGAQPGRWIVKLDALGGLVWQKRLKNAIGGVDSAGKERRALLRLPDDSVVVAGDASLGNGAQVWLTALDSKGSLLWQRLYQQPSGTAAAAYGLARSTTGDLLVAGESYLFNSPGQIKSPIALSLSGTGSISSCSSLVDTAALVDDGTAVQAAQDFSVTPTTLAPTPTTVTVSSAASPPVSEACSSSDAGFLLACAPTVLSAAPGASAQVTCTVSSVGGFSSQTNLACASLPPGLSCGWSSAAVVPPPNSSLATTLTVSANPSAPAGVYSFTVAATSGAGSQTVPMSFQVPAPIVGSLTPAFGPSTGGTAMTIKGDHFGPGMGVAMGGAQATAVVVVDPTTIQAKAPAHAPGDVAVVLTNASGQALSAPNTFTYVCPASPLATVSGDTSICPGESTTIQVAFKGTPPYSIQWWDGLAETGLTSTVVTRTVMPLLTTTYGVDLFSDAACQGSAAGSATVTVDTSKSCGSFFTLPPCRVVDTRNVAGDYGGPALAAAGQRLFSLAGLCGVPSTAKALSLNVTVVNPTATGFLTIYPGGSILPATSNINYRPGETRANNGVARLATGASLSVFVGQASGTVDLVIDVNGYFQ
jgi:pimeloyl-ACP methyl ester carboxylesterase